MIGDLRDKLEGRGGAVGFVAELYRRFNEDECFFRAAGISYYGVFSLFPLLLVSVSLLGYFLPTSSLHNQIEVLIDSYAPGVSGFVIENLNALVEYRGQIGIIGTVSLLWVGSAVFSAISRSLKMIWKGPSADANFWRTRGVGIFMVFVIGLLVLLSVAISAGASLFRSYEAELVEEWGIPILADTLLWQVAARFLPILLSFIAFLVIYKVFPMVRIRFAQVYKGALFSAIAFEGAKIGFAFYLRQGPDFRMIHGSLTTMVLLLLWMYVAVLILFLGAEINVLLNERRGTHDAAGP